MEVHDITFWLGDKQIKRFRTLLSPDDPEYTQVKKNALMWFKLSEGAHYDNITTELLNQVSKFNIENKEQWQNSEYKKETQSESKAGQVTEKTEAAQVATESFHAVKQPLPKSGTTGSGQIKDTFTTTTSHQSRVSRCPVQSHPNKGMSSCLW